jgi:hypothetical protein
MKRSLWPLVGGLVLVVGLLGWYFFKRGADNVAIDLIAQFPQAKEKRPVAEKFSVVSATLHGETKQAILVEENSPECCPATRLKYQLTVPDNAWLRVGLGLKEEAWTQQGDGVLFRILVTAGSTQDVLLSMQINPFANAGDREWKEPMLDLSEYAGENVELIFLTNSSAPGKDDRNGDLALWGAPRIIVK